MVCIEVLSDKGAVIVQQRHFCGTEEASVDMDNGRGVEEHSFGKLFNKTEISARVLRRPVHWSLG